MTTKILGTQIENFSITTEQLGANTTAAFVNRSLLTDFATSAEVAEFATSLGPKITSVNVANSAFTVLDDTAVNIGGGYIVVTGENFVEGATVLIDTISATSVSRINSTTLRVQVPARPAASYNLYVVNPDGGTGIKVAGITYSGTPTWVTTSPLNYGVNNRVFAINLSATPATSYAVANGSTLPAGTELLANGYFYGVGTVAADTTYSFDVVATDAELQDSSKTFGLTVYLTAPRTLWAAGNNQYGQLGNNNLIYRSTPTQVGVDFNWSKISTAAGDVIATKTNNTLWAWGNNPSGRLGVNDFNRRSSPVQVGTDTDWSMVDAGNQATAAIRTNGTLWTWGNNASGRLGLSHNFNRSSPVQVGTDTDWSMVSFCEAALKTNGTLWTWGNNSAGQLGTNSVLSRSSPAQVGTDTNWSFVSADNNGVSVIKTNGTLWTWGENSNGRLGNNNIIARSSPVQVGTDTWSQVAFGSSSLAIRTNGTLWAWGLNGNGQLGHNDLINKSSPTQVGTLTNWSKVTVASGFTTALKTDGTLWTWGTASEGRLGDNQTASARSSPVQIGTSVQQWSELSFPGFSNGVIAIGG
jgi:alpha-tubulin suppressor-like RCC1 family protein